MIHVKAVSAKTTRSRTSRQPHPTKPTLPFGAITGISTVLERQSFSICTHKRPSALRQTWVESLVACVAMDSVLNLDRNFLTSLCFETNRVELDYRGGVRLRPMRAPRGTSRAGGCVGGFSLLCGVFLHDIPNEWRGNFAVWYAKCRTCLSCCKCLLM